MKEKVSAMTSFKNLVAITGTVACIALANTATAQDDLDDLLADLDSTAPAAQAKPAEEKAAEPEVKAEEKVEEVVAEDKVEEKAEEPAPAVAATDSETEKVEASEEKTEEKAEEVAEEKPAATEEKAEEPAVAAAEPAAEEKSSKKVDEVLSLLDDLASEAPAEKAEEVAEVKPAAVEEKVAEAEPEVKAEVKAEVPAAPVKREFKFEGEDAELLAGIFKTEEVRRKALDVQANREIREARASMASEEYTEAARHYGIAAKLLNGSASSKALIRECEQGIAESLYRAAMQEDKTGRRDRAMKLIGKAVDMRHPKARRQLELWQAAGDPDANKTDVSEISHRKNEEDYKLRRQVERHHLRRARELLGLRELDKALEECELVLVGDPYNQEAIRLREAIQKKRMVILQQEFKTARDGWIADVEKAWRPVYAVDAREIDNRTATTLRTNVGGDDPERSQEQAILKRMKEMRLPSISFKPPATISDAVDYFRAASKDYDRPELPLEQRGFNFVLKTPQALVQNQPAAEEESDDFASGGEDAATGVQGIPLIPNIAASDIPFDEALKLVCDSVDYKFKVQGKIVMIMPRDMTTEEMVIRNYPVIAAFIEKMDTAKGDMQELRNSTSFGSNSNKRDDGEENKEKDWKEFFTQMGVQWPEGSSIFYMKALGKLRVKNTYENLAEFEKALNDLNVQQYLIEIESRFVEVCQEDLNSLGFEWILNSDYSLNLNNRLGKALGVRNGDWGRGGSTSTDASSSTVSGGAGGIGGPISYNPTDGSTPAGSSSTSASTIGAGQSWSKGTGSRRNVGVNAFGGTSDQQNGTRYLSTKSNPISGESQSTNDQFMRVNAFLGSADLSMILHMLSQRTDTDLLSAPKVLTRPGEQAVMKVVTEYIYPTDYDVQLQSSSSSSGSSSSGSGSQSAILAVVEPQSFVTREVGVILDVTPTLTDDGNLIDLTLNTQVVDEPTWKNYGMKIPFTGNSSQTDWSWIGDVIGTASSIMGEVSQSVRQEIGQKIISSALNTMDQAGSDSTITYYDAPMEQPFFHVRSIDSKVSVYPGATIVMGGLITEQRKAMDDKIPFLGDIPYIGRLFRSHAEQTSKRNLLIFVTTRLVDTRGREVTMSSSEDNSQVKAAPSPEAAE